MHRFFCFMYIKCYINVITVQNYTDAEVHTITVGNKELFWVKMIDEQNRLGIKMFLI